MLKNALAKPLSHLARTVRPNPPPPPAPKDSTPKDAGGKETGQNAASSTPVTTGSQVNGSNGNQTASNSTANNQTGSNSVTTNSGSTQTQPQNDDPTSSGLGDAVDGTTDGALIREGVEKLNGDGDSAYLRITPEVKAQGNVRFGQLGLKGQLGADMRVTQNGEGDDATFTLRYDKQSLGAVTGEVGTDTLGKGKTKGTGTGSVDGKIKAEVGGQTFDAVEMTFDSKEDAIKAAETIQKLHLADMGSDAIDMAIMGTGPLSVPLGAVKDTLSGGGDNPLANPLNDDGAPGSLSQQIAGVSDEDLAFLRDNVTAYETTIGTRGRLAAEVKGDMKHFNLALEGRLDETRRITRRVELPTDDQDGSVTYSLEGGMRLSGKEKAQKGFKANGIGIEPKFENRLDLAQASAEVSLTYTIPKGSDVPETGSNRPAPELMGFSGTDGLELESVSFTNTLEYRTQGFDDLSRGDSQKLTSTVTFQDPDKIAEAAGQFFDGEFEQAASTVGARIDLDAQTIDRTGIATQTGVKVKFGVGEAEASVIYESGVDDVTTQFSKTIEPQSQPDGDQNGDTTTETQIPPDPEDDGQTLVVTPWEGLNVRDEPGGDTQGLLQNGTFLRDQGDRQTDAEGNEWIKVTGTDYNDEPVEGWVSADHVQHHSSATGAMDETGRTNPTLEHNRYDAVTVEQDDNLWDLAEKYGVDPHEMIELNQDHLLNPSLIYKGDTVYIPGTERGPEPVEVEVPVTPEPDTESEDTGSEDTGSNDSTDSSSSPDQPSTSEPDNSSSSTDPQSTEPDNSSSSTDPQPSEPDTTSSTSDPQAADDPQAAPTTTPTDEERQQELDDILTEYQVDEDEMVEWAPYGQHWVASQTVTSKEAEALDSLWANPLNYQTFKDISDPNKDNPGLSWKAADEYFPQMDANGDVIAGGEDGHNDAFRHAYWNALMVDRFGEDFAASMGTAHEGVEGNPAVREAMDLYNNEVGRQIAIDNPDASDEELAELVYEAVQNGEMVVVDQNGNLAWSDQVEYGQTGSAAGGTLPGQQEVPDPSGSN